MKVLGWMLIAVISVGLVACGGDESGDTPKAGENGTTPEGGGGDEGGGDEGGGDEDGGDTVVPGVTPTAAFEKVKETWAGRKFSALYGMLSTDTRGTIDEYVGKVKGLASKAMEQAGLAAALAKSALKKEWGVDAEEYLNMSAEDAGGAIIEHLEDDDPPGVFKPESKVLGEKIDGNKATLTVQKPSGKKKEIEMVKEGDTWVLVYDW